VARLAPVDVPSSVGFVFETVRLVRKALAERVPLIGFAGAPFTLASYLIEGGASREFLHTKRFMRAEPAAWHGLMTRLAGITAEYLNGQIAAGAQAVQLFDSWVGTLSPADYREFVLPHSRAVLSALAAGAPAIHFGTGTATLLELMKEAGGDVIGLDWRVELGAAWDRLGGDVAVQGNLDPAILLAPVPEIRRAAGTILEGAAGRAGHIFNLGHGVHQETPVDHVRALVDMVHEMSAR
jgi:uroporphyrinogen decarboxylase